VTTGHINTFYSWQDRDLAVMQNVLLASSDVQCDMFATTDRLGEMMEEWMALLHARSTTVEEKIQEV